MDPERLNDWLVVLQSAGIFLVGVFILLFEVLARPVPDATAMGAGLTMLFGAPARAWLYGRGRNGKNGSEDDDKWSHLP